MSANEFSGVGFAAGVVTGVRSFEVDKLGRLTGVTVKQIWKPGENTAECRAAAVAATSMWASTSFLSNLTLTYGYGGVVTATPEKPKENLLDYSKPHDMEKCKHGFYAYYDGSNDYKTDDRISGVVEGYGETVIGTRGFRAMKARIVALRINKDVPAHVAAMLRRNYPSVPFFDSFKAMVAEFPPDHAGNGITPESDPDFWTRSI
jgi:hypothetical protein